MQADETIIPGEAVPETTEPLAPVESHNKPIDPSIYLVDDKPVFNSVFVDNVATKPLPTVNTKAAVSKKTYKRKGKTYSISLNATQSERLDEILKARQQNNLSENSNQMLKQIINFAVNHQEGWEFGVPKFETKVFFDK